MIKKISSLSDFIQHVGWWKIHLAFRRKDSESFFVLLKSELEIAVKIVKAAWVLHNFLRFKKSADRFENNREEQQQPLVAD